MEKRGGLQIVQQQGVKDVVPAGVGLLGREIRELEVTFEHKKAGLHAPTAAVGTPNTGYG